MFTIMLDIIGALVSPFISLLGTLLIPVIIIGAVLFLFVLLSPRIHPTKAEKDRLTRYQNSRTPVGYRRSVSFEQPSWFPSCYYCPCSKETYEEHGACIKSDVITQAEEWIANTVYCSKYDIDVYSYYTCDMRYNVE